jgi:4-aminobutyrate aminotransferase-like enzyme
MMALEFDSGELVQKIVHQCLKKGVITFWFLSTENSFRLAPPLTIKEKEIHQACEIILSVINNIS